MRLSYAELIKITMGVLKEVESCSTLNVNEELTNVEIVKRPGKDIIVGVTVVGTNKRGF